MQNNIPVPTDNIFKFYALFGLLLFVFSCGSLLYVNHSTNDALMGGIIELEALKQIEKPSRVESAKIIVLEKKIEITQNNKGFYVNGIGVLAGFAMIAMGYGFFKWHTEVQPVLDETAKVQIEIAKMQLKQLRRGLGIEDESQPPSIAAPAAPPSVGDRSSEVLEKSKISLQ